MPSSLFLLLSRPWHLGHVLCTLLGEWWRWGEGLTGWAPPYWVCPPPLSLLSSLLFLHSTLFSSSLLLPFTCTLMAIWSQSFNQLPLLHETMERGRVGQGVATWLWHGELGDIWVSLVLSSCRRWASGGLGGGRWWKVVVAVHLLVGSGCAHKTKKVVNGAVGAILQQ